MIKGYNPLSIKQDKEYSGLVYFDPSKKVVGSQAGILGNNTNTGILLQKMAAQLPDGAVILAHWHTHGGLYLMGKLSDGTPIKWAADRLGEYTRAEMHNFSDGDRWIMRDFMTDVGRGQGTIQGTDGRRFEVDPQFEMYLGMQNGEMLRMDQSLRSHRF